MNRTDFEVLLFRTQDTYPSAAAPRQGTLEEWATSSLARFPAATVFAAFDDWKESHDWPPTIHQMIEQTQATARDLAAARAAIQAGERQQYLDGTAVTFRCGTCQDDGTLPLVGPDSTADEARHAPRYPCPDCRPETHARWKAGHFMPGHDCGECSAIRRGRKLTKPVDA